MAVENRQVVFVSTAMAPRPGVYSRNGGFACSIVLDGPDWLGGGVRWLVREIDKAVQRCQAAIPEGVVQVSICEGPCQTKPT